ncbi:hypothetical protein LX81_03315 [Palleronia aestuarii]|uniref:Autotransporter domain-containing protein n=1 Tax=Palleronia aestuarii TaxID=568105 RepID=A0A2W7N408_9RHOB|nr:hypothetical protein [Palleronia aestuarii]PZX13087.1 hypothetical protein LX81_03315 [Palleronia aestuarii]
MLPRKVPSRRPGWRRRLGLRAGRLALTVLSLAATPAAADETIVLAALPAPAEIGSEALTARMRIRGRVLGTARSAVDATLDTDRRMMEAARDRFAAARRTLRTFDGAGYAGRNVVPFDLEGTAGLEAGTWRSDGRFFGQSGSFDGRRRRLVLGSFDVEKAPSGRLEARVEVRTLRERMHSETLMLGYYLGAEIARDRSGGGDPEAAHRIGAAFGTYAVRSLGDALYLDGYVSFGIDRAFGRHAARDLDFEGAHSMPRATVGGTLSGFVGTGGLRLRPRLSLAYGQAAPRRTRMWHDGRRAFSLGDGRAATLALALSPDLDIALDTRPVEEARAVLSVSPRLECREAREIETVSRCARSAEIGLERRFPDAARRLGVTLGLGRQARETRARISVRYEHAF